MKTPPMPPHSITCQITISKIFIRPFKKKLKVMGEGFMVHLRVKPPLLVATLITCVFPYLSCATSYGHKYPCFLKLCMKSNTKPNFNPF